MLVNLIDEGVTSDLQELDGVGCPHRMSDSADFGEEFALRNDSVEMNGGALPERSGQVVVDDSTVVAENDAQVGGNELGICLHQR